MHAESGAAVRGLDRHGVAADHALRHQIERRRRAHALERIARDEHALRPGSHAVVLTGDLAVLRQRGVERVFVPRAMAHARGRPDERNAQKLEEALDGAVLAVLAVQRVVHHVGPLAAQRGHELRVGVERHHAMPRLLERSADVLAAFQGELTLERGSSHQNRYLHVELLLRRKETIPCFSSRSSPGETAASSPSACPARAGGTKELPLR